MVTVNTGASALQMAQEIFGDGVTVTGASYTGDNRSSGLYSNADQSAQGFAPSENGVILSTGRATSVYNNSGSNPNIRTSTTTNTSGVNNDAQFNALAGSSTFDAAWLDIDFIPTSDTMSLQFVFASEEYPEFSNSIYNDAVGVWLNGTPASMTVGDGSTSVGNVNQIDNINLYNDNTGDAFFTEMDGFTVTLTLTMTVIPGVVNSIRIGIADVVDSSYDSNLLIAANSAQTVLIATDDKTHIDLNSSKTINILNNDQAPTGAVLTITHINGVAVNAGDTVNLPNGQSVLLNANGTITVTVGSTQELAPFTYTISDGTNTDTGIVMINTVPCFVAGTLIRTARGERPVEEIAAGDLVLTQDNGFQPVRWVGQRRLVADDHHAPIRIAAHSFGVHRTLLVSPQHRIMIRDAVSELLFEEPEVFVAAKHLVNGRTVTQELGGDVTYVHLLFDDHQVIFSEGLASESFQPGPQSTELFDAESLQEMQAALPGLDPVSGDGYGVSARRTLREYEAMVLVSALPPVPGAQVLQVAA